MHAPALRIGHGFDRHRLDALAPDGEGKPLAIGGVAMESSIGPIAHSDGDCLFHAITDALLGARALPDIGQLFPNTDQRWRDADSATLLGAALARVSEGGWSIVNLDATLVLDEPRLSAHKGAIVQSIAQILRASEERINVKGKTHERAPGDPSPQVIEAHVVVLLSKDTS
ncbi:MAG: 2-C-methyl-D-erythritol 2,4-cyclodiphosphate synthase [Planctomycetota bacterium]|jgi:2-C-methyl-D-erythritol 2,4-cyclodiphosphate synthase